MRIPTPSSKRFSAPLHVTFARYEYYCSMSHPTLTVLLLPRSSIFDMHDIQTLKLKIGAVKSKIVNAEKLLQDQKDALAELLRALDEAERAQAIAPFVSALPTEVLVRIFQLVLVVNAVADYAQVPNLRTALRLVCSEWNQVILHGPELWTTVYIDVEREFESQNKPSGNSELLDQLQKVLGRGLQMSQLQRHSFPKSAMDRVTRDIKRGKNQLQNLRLVLPHSFYWVLNAGINPIGDDVFKFIHQFSNWGSISISFTDDRDSAGGQVPRFFRPNGLTSPQPSRIWSTVHTLDLSMPLDKEQVDDIDDFGLLPQQAHESHEERSSTTPKFSLTAKTCPKLRNVSLKMAARNLHQWTLPWSQLTDLTLGAFTNPFSDYVRILRDCGALEKLDVYVELTHKRFYLPKALRDPGAVPVEAALPRLHTLALRADVRCDMLESLVGCLRLPSLHTFSYTNSFDEDVGDRYFSTQVINWLSTLIKKSHCSIKKLTLDLYEATLKDSALSQRFFDLVPALEELSLTGRLLPCEFLKRRKLPETLDTLLIYNICCAEGDPKANFAEWAEQWVSDERCRGQEGREGKLMAAFVTVLHPYYRHDPKGEGALRRVGAPHIIDELRKKGVDVGFLSL